MTAGWWRWIWVMGLLPGAALPGAASADEAHSLNPHPELVRTYYDYGVVVYCRLVDMPVHNGYALLRNDQMARGNIAREGDRRAWVDANLAVDLEYLNRGLAGQKNWCLKEGAEAAARFTTYFRTRRLP